MRRWRPSKDSGILARAPFVEAIDRQGERFFQTGRSLLSTLSMFIESVKTQKFSSLDRFYAETFRGNHLGLTTLKLESERDGICSHSFCCDQIVIDRQDAIAEWRKYIESFKNVEEISLHLHRLEKWKSADAIAASVRFEHIGTLRGAKRSCIDRAYFRTEWERNGDALQLKKQTLIKGERVFSEQPQFLNVAAEAGIDLQNQYYPPFLSEPLRFGMIRYGPGGITAVDYDNDGLCDLFIPDGVESKLFRNRGDGTFEDVTERAGLAGLDGVSVALFADYDNDGFKDLFVSRTFQPNQLFHNNGDGTFTDVTEKSGIGPDCCTTVAAWGDYDNDGHLDLYVGRYLDPRKDIPTTFYARNGEPNQLYHNNGDGTFTNVTERAGVGDKGLCLGAVWGDYNDDGFPDLYVVNDFGRKTLYRNNGDGTFKDVTVKSNTLAYGAGMSASFVDYDNDGKFDYYVTHIRSEHAWFAEAPTVKRYMLRCFSQGTWKTDMPLYMEIMRQSGMGFVGVFQQMASGNTLLRNNGDGTFEDMTLHADANPPGWFWGAVFADFDNDGWQDLYAANGWVYNNKGTEIELDFLYNVVTNQKTYKTGIFFDPDHFGTSSWHGWERNRHLRSNRDGTFSEVGNAAGTDLLVNSRGVAVADFWNRGVMDMAIAASNDRHALLKNMAVYNRNWLQVELVGTKSNRDAVGARVTIYLNGAQQSREVVLGDSYGSQSSLRLHFGLNHHQNVDRLVVRWPASGIVQTFENVAVNRIVEITEGEDRLVEKRYASVMSTQQSAARAEPAVISG
ncbi:MAG TPA: CRTAC1 family protein [Candidatus Angelobacter sp.]|nr:CRTAC1 family protein [Candidatus Angelobacter sp.]